jgi:pimeloyl-ACP methyl ester carboxylesterase
MHLHSLGKAHIVGHSYGALVALCLAIRHPELVRSLVLSEATAVSLLKHSRGPNRERCDSTWSDIQKRMVDPMKKAFQRHQAEPGAKIFVNYVLNDSLAWDRFAASIKTNLLAGTQEWDVMMNGGTLFFDITPEQVNRILVPVLMLSAEHSYPFLGLIDQELHRLLPNNQHVVIKNAGHRMWADQPEECRNLTLQFIGQH